MNALAALASTVVAFTGILFVSASYAEGMAGDAYRKALRTLGWMGVAILTYPTGKVIGTFVALIAPLTSGRQPTDNPIRWYRYQRAYKGTHFQEARV